MFFAHRITILLLTLFSLIFSFPSLAYQPLQKLPKGSRVSLLLQKIEPQPQDKAAPPKLAINNQQFFQPASTLKVITALAAKLELGDNFRFLTQIKAHNNDLIIQFSGDPSLNYDHLVKLFTQLKQAGFTTIRGDIWLDNQAFSGYQRAIGWPWDITGVCYSAPSSAITLDGNCVQASIYTQADGKTRVHIPEHLPATATTTAITVTKEQQQQQQCDLELIAFANNHYQLSGCVVKQEKPIPLKFALQQPERYVQARVKKLLKQLNLTLLGEIKIGVPANSSDHNDANSVLAQHYSAPLPQLLTIMLQQSNNLYADNLLKTVGAHFAQRQGVIQAGSFNNGTKALKQILSSQANIDLSHTKLVDGSGLSRNNRLTANDLAQVLLYIAKNDSRLKLIELLPIAGTNGTLQYRSSMRNDPIKGNLVAKSGSIYGTYNMIGFGLNKAGKPSSIFVQLVGDYFPTPKEQSSNSVKPITQFEQLFYKDIVTFSH